MMITVLIADDHPIVQQGMQMLLEVQEDIKVIGVATDGAEAVEMATSSQPDVVLLDLNMPEMNGIEATRVIRHTCPHTQIVILTSHHEDAMVFPAIKAGALSYLLKSVSPDEVVTAVRAAAQNEARLHPRVARRLMDEVAGVRVSVEALTSRELEVLKEIARGHDNKTIAANLVLSEKTVKTHVSNILSKLQLEDRTQAAIFALKSRLVPLDNES
ncbi:MAG: DNA-binding response regulator [Chloroflexi bacterium]|nr:MAG: DNA-binding response regulator [Chloroflexota bacterium]